MSYRIFSYNFCTDLRKNKEKNAQRNAVRGKKIEKESVSLHKIIYLKNTDY